MLLARPESPSVPVSTHHAATQLCGLLRVRFALPFLRFLATGPRLAARHAAETVAGMWPAGWRENSRTRRRSGYSA